MISPLATVPTRTRQKNPCKEVEEAIKTKLLESGVEFKTRIGVVTACHTGPTAIGAALMPKFDHI